MIRKKYILTNPPGERADNLRQGYPYPYLGWASRKMSGSEQFKLRKALVFTAAHFRFMKTLLTRQKGRNAGGIDNSSNDSSDDMRKSLQFPPPGEPAAV